MNGGPTCTGCTTGAEWLKEGLLVVRNPEWIAGPRPGDVCRVDHVFPVRPRKGHRSVMLMTPRGTLSTDVEAVIPAPVGSTFAPPSVNPTPLEDEDEDVEGEEDEDDE